MALAAEEAANAKNYSKHPEKDKKIESKGRKELVEKPSKVKPPTKAEKIASTILKKVGIPVSDPVSP